MTPIETPNAHFTLTDGIAALQITGKLKPDTFDNLRDAFDALQASGSDATVLLSINREHFDNLATAREAFGSFTRLLRRLPGLERCAVVTDTEFLRNSAKVEGAALPGLTLMTFAPEGREAAESWLRGEALTDAAKTSNKTSNDNAEDSDNPWDNLNLAKIAH